jgi:HAUS augmin-like complex subunit 1
MAGVSSAAAAAATSESGNGNGSGGDGVFDASHVADVKAWLKGAFEAVGKEVPEFEYTPRTVAHLHNLAVLSQHRTHSATIVAADLRQRASEFRSQGKAPACTFSFGGIVASPRILCCNVCALHLTLQVSKVQC